MCDKVVNAIVASQAENKTLKDINLNMTAGRHTYFSYSAQDEIDTLRRKGVRIAEE